MFRNESASLSWRAPTLTHAHVLRRCSPLLLAVTMQWLLFCLGLRRKEEVCPLIHTMRAIALIVDLGPSKKKQCPFARPLE